MSNFSKEEYEKALELFDEWSKQGDGQLRLWLLNKIKPKKDELFDRFKEVLYHTSTIGMVSNNLLFDKFKEVFKKELNSNKALNEVRTLILNMPAKHDTNTTLNVLLRNVDLIISKLEESK